jgi:hypothetical protein
LKKIEPSLYFNPGFKKNLQQAIVLQRAARKVLIKKRRLQLGSQGWAATGGKKNLTFCKLACWERNLTFAPVHFWQTRLVDLLRSRCDFSKFVLLRRAVSGIRVAFFSLIPG